MINQSTEQNNLGEMDKFILKTCKYEPGINSPTLKDP